MKCACGHTERIRNGTQKEAASYYRQHLEDLNMTGDEMRPLYEDGMTIEQLSLETGHTAGTVRKRLREAGTEIRPAGPPKGQKYNRVDPTPVSGPSIMRAPSRHAHTGHRRRGYA